MSHEISIQNGVAEMFSGNGLTPWHKLGTVVQGLKTAKEALQLAHLDWNVRGMPVTVNGITLPFPNGETADTWQGICREDTGACLGIMRGRYECIQNAEAFDFFDNLVGAGEAVYDTAGALRGGKQVWLLAKVDGIRKVAGDDHRTWALMVTSHDGSYSMMVQWVYERVVCANTLSIALRGAQSQVKIRHCKSWKDKESEARRVLGIGNSYFDNVQAALGALNDKLMTPEQMSEFSKLLIAAKDESDVSTRAKNIRAELDGLFQRGAGNKGATRWDALNAVTDYADHEQTIRGGNSTRLESSLLGSGAMLKQKAFDLLTDEDVMGTLLAKTHKPSASVAVTGADFSRLLNQ